MVSNPVLTGVSGPSRSARVQALRDALASRVVVADGATGTMLQSLEPTMEDFTGLEGCNEVLSVNRPDLVDSVHVAYLDAGVDCIKTNTFGGNYSALAEYDIADRVFELSEASARIARDAADRSSEESGQQRWVLGSMGPGTKLPTLGHLPYTTLRDAYQASAEGLIGGGTDALLVETSQDLLQARSAVLGARRAMDKLGAD
ncbi:homocysteine S-methyltransferase family protein, partial [Streptomyces coffeae]